MLGCLRRTEATTVPAAIVFERTESRRDQIERAIRWLERQDLVHADNGNLTLTDTGRREAKRLLRAHRLWESYLQYVGTPAARLHDAADRLEHLHDESTVDYLDDKLGHPLHDPHGSEIPEDFIDLVPGKPVKASLLRSGHRATMVSLDVAAHGSALEVGIQITAGPRREEDKLWAFLLPNGKEFSLDHKTVDAVIVTVERADAAT